MRTYIAPDWGWWQIITVPPDNAINEKNKVGDEKPCNQ